jgi:dUTP pyrophosphatase
VAIALPDGYVGLVHPRSGLAAKHGFTLVNAPGTIDAGYRGEIAVIGINTDAVQPLRIERGERIAQLLVQQVCSIDWLECDELPGSDRAGGGLGSTGTR